MENSDFCYFCILIARKSESFSGTNGWIILILTLNMYIILENAMWLLGFDDLDLIFKVTVVVRTSDFNKTSVIASTRIRKILKWTNQLQFQLISQRLSMTTTLLNVYCQHFISHFNNFQASWWDQIALFCLIPLLTNISFLISCTLTFFQILFLMH